MKRFRLQIYTGIVLAAFIFCSLTAGAQQTKVQNGSAQKPDVLNNRLTYPVLFHQTSAEYRALCHQAFNSARIYLEELLKQRGSDEKYAIITDVDETMVDNSYLEARLIKEGKEYNSKFWNEWVALSAATEVPGALEFTNWAASKGVEIFYVSNRKIAEVPATIKNLKKLGFPYADSLHAIFMDKESSKESRRQKISSTHKVVMLIGDNLNDFADIFERKSIQERFDATDKFKNEWGTKFIVLPNPMYGEWENALYEYKRSLTPDEKNEKLLGKLKSF